MIVVPTKSEPPIPLDPSAVYDIVFWSVMVHRVIRSDLLRFAVPALVRGIRVEDRFKVSPILTPGVDGFGAGRLIELSNRIRLVLRVREPSRGEFMFNAFRVDESHFPSSRCSATSSRT